ncbi:MAG TPA: HAMP domain-containing sensor histidine kinase [Phototrophicaceae bacterium]|nr:HAMP domain-containing sensor histidine kinase [Phototrophicaceae bacterium]
MLKRLTIRQRILLIFTSIVVVGSILQLLIAGGQLQNETLDFYRQQLETDALIGGVSLGGSLERFANTDESRAGLQNLLAALQNQVGQDVVLTDRDFDVIGYTQTQSVQYGQRLSLTPELTQAQTNTVGTDIRTDADGVRRLYAAAPLVHDSRLIGYIILSQPTAPMDADVRQRWLELALGTLPIVALVIAASLWISGTISRPIQQLRNSALQMAAGALDTRIAEHGEDEVGQLGKAFNYMAEQLENLLQSQRSFISNAAHELRTPLMTIKLRIEGLSDTQLSSAQRSEYLLELHQEVDYMAQLVTSLLTLARIDEGRHTVDATEKYDSVALLQDIARHWRIEAQKAQVKFQAEIAPDIPDLSIPANDLRIVLDNLLSNALKYTPQGTITMTARSEAATLKLSVVDTGQGFAAGEAEHLFTRFYRTPEVRAQHIPGTGLGLAIVREILKQNQGEIKAKSAGIGSGASFTVTLPLTPAAASSSEPFHFPLGVPHASPEK